jgi:hypothetical protein
MSRHGEIHKKPSPSARLNMSIGQKGKRIPPRTQAQKVHISKIQLQNREHFSQKAKEQWQDPEIRDRQTKAILAGSHIRPTKAEYELEILLDIACPNEYKYTGDGQVVIGGMSPDFTNIKGKEKLVEMFGDFWHQGQNPQDKIERYKKYGFDCLVIWEHDLKEKTKFELITIIKEFNNSDINIAKKEVINVEINKPVQLSLF